MTEELPYRPKHHPHCTECDALLDLLANDDESGLVLICDCTKQREIEFDDKPDGWTV